MSTSPWVYVPSALFVLDGDIGSTGPSVPVALRTRSWTSAVVLVTDPVYAKMDLPLESTATA